MNHDTLPSPQYAGEGMMAKRCYALVSLFLAAALLIIPSSSAASFSPRPADRLEVARFIVPSSHPNHVPPGDWTVSDPATAQQIEQAIIALPAPPDGVRFCPIDYGVRYRFTFFDRGIVIFQAVADAGGCLELHLGNSEDRQTNYAFWLLLSRTLHVSMKQGLFLGGPAPSPAP